MRILPILFAILIGLGNNSAIAQSGSAINSLGPLRGVALYYWDTVTTKGKKTYREFTHVGDDEIWSKPQSFDIKIDLDTMIKVKGIVQIAIEEFQGSSKVQLMSNEPLEYMHDTTWVLNKVVYADAYSGKSTKIEIRNVSYESVSFIDHMVISKYGFRVVVFFRPNNSGAVQVLKREFYLD